MPTDRIRCKTGEVYVDEGGLIVIEQTPGAVQDWDSACELVAATQSLTPEGQLAAIVVHSNQSKTTRDGRDAFAQKGAEVLACCAMITVSRISEVTGNFFIRLNQPQFPMRLFRDPAAARAWAISYVGTPR